MLIIFQSIVASSINGKINVSKDIVNLLEDTKCLLIHFNDSRMEYCNRTINRETVILVKKKNFLLYLVCYKRISSHKNTNCIEFSH